MQSEPEIVVDRRAWTSLWVVILGTLVISLDTTIANLALPKIVERWPTSDVDWVVTAYLIGLGLSQPGAAWIIDRFGSRRTFMFAMALLSLSALGAGLSPTFELLVMFRLFQGLAGGALVPVCIAVIAHAFPPHRRGWVMGMWSTVSMVAPAVGPLIGGYLLTNASWRWAFLMHVPIGLAATVGSVKLLADYGERTTAPLDVIGWALASVGLLSLLIAFAQADSWGWVSTPTGLLGALAVVSLTAFVMQQRRAKDPLLAMEIFAAPGFTLTMWIIAFGSVAYVARLVFMPLELDAVRGMDPLQIGWLLMPAAIGSMVASMVCGRLMGRVGARPLVIFGGVALLISHFALGDLAVDSSRVWIATVMTVQIMGATFTILPATVAALDSMPARFAGQVAMVRSMVRQVAAAFGVAVLASLLRADLAKGDRGDRNAVQSAYNRIFLIMIVLGVAVTAIGWMLPKMRRPEVDQSPGSSPISRSARRSASRSRRAMSGGR